MLISITDSKVIFFMTKVKKKNLSSVMYFSITVYLVNILNVYKG